MSPEIDFSSLNDEIHRSERKKKIVNDIKEALEIIQELKGTYLEKDNPFWPLVLLQVFQEVRSSANIFPVIASPYQDKDEISFDPLEESLAHIQPRLNFVSLKEYLKDREKDHIQKALDLNNRNTQKAAGDLGISRTTLWRKVKEYGIGTKARKKS